MKLEELKLLNLSQLSNQSESQTFTLIRFTSAKFVSAIPLLNIDQKKKKDI